MHTERKGCKSSLIVFLLLLVLVSVGFTNFSNFALEVQAQKSSSCDKDVISLVECSPLTSSPPASEDSSSVADDIDEKDSNDEDNGEDDNGEEQEEDGQKNGDIESKIPSTAGVPFP
jgi:hypothetical protein